ncbi:MAG: hypothetical protein IKW00_02790 [Clostridia bacterium]|nr:hypothetical protein [Clostridia bacterium]
MPVVSVDFSGRPIGSVRPLHGVNSGPMTKVFTYDARPQFIEAGFPYARLHDVEYPYGSGEFVDIPCIFKNYDADETDPANYNFGLTDEYLKVCMEVGSEPLFRLGVSIEHAPVKRYVYPPADYEKWARICEHIIRHYTEGWANGFHWQIKYWEIWNEADNCIKGSTNMWLGTPEQFFELYCVAAAHLKEKFPHLKIGGCGFTRAYSPFMEDFFKYLCAKPQRIPLDFYSWHLYYSDVSELLASAVQADDLKKRYGYENAENIFDEWNYMHDWSNQPESYPKIKNHIGAAHCAATLCAMQSKTSIALATYFEADVVKEWCGLFEVDKMSHGKQKATVRPLKPFYAFKAFNELYKMKHAVAARCDSENIYACASSDGKRAGVLAANYMNEDTVLTFDLQGIPAGEVLEVRIIDEDKTFDTLITLEGNNSVRFSLPLKSNAVVYIGSKII